MCMQRNSQMKRGGGSGEERERGRGEEISDLTEKHLKIHTLVLSYPFSSFVTECCSNISIDSQTHNYVKKLNSS